MGFDLLTGIASGFINKNLRSRVGIIGLIKKLSLFFTIILFCLLFKITIPEIYMKASIFIILSYMFLELISILENLNKMGVNVKPLQKYLEQFRQDKNLEGDDKNDNKL